MNPAGKEVNEEESVLDVKKKEKESVRKGPQTSKVSNPPAWREMITGGHRLKFILDTGTVKTIVRERCHARHEGG